MAQKPRFRVPAGTGSSKSFTHDSFQNLAAQLGYGTESLSTANSYNFYPITRNRTQLEWAYRGSWIVRQVVDAVADDMTRAGVRIESEMPPDDMEQLQQAWLNYGVWADINSAVKWARLYGGCIAVMMIEGQKMDTPLRIDSVMKGQFKGLIVLDRWMVWPDLTKTVQEFGPEWGKPEYYEIVTDIRGLPKMRIHYSRVIRLDGVELPYWQTISENGWSLSVLEPLFDRMVAFDSVTQGAAQLAFKAHLRVVKIEGYREMVAAGGQVYQAFLQQMNMIRLMQSNEGLTVLDASDDFVAQQYTFAGLSDLLVQFGQQLSGGAQIPLTRLFGQSPAGMNATGESDMRNYYDGINAQQESKLRRGLQTLWQVTHRSVFDKPLPDGFAFSFVPLWQLTEAEKAQIATQVTQMVDQAKMGGLVGGEVALKELRQSSHITGYWSNVTDEDIKKAKEDDAQMPSPAEMLQMQQQQGGGDNAQSGESAQPTQPAQSKETDSDDDAEAMVPQKPKRRLANKKLAALFPNTKGLNETHLPAYARKVIRNKQDIVETYAHKANGHTLQDVRALYLTHHTQDDDKTYPMKQIHGMTVIIETPKGTTRTGYGWASTVAADYGYISKTGSAEGGSEQFDCFIGDDPTRTEVWIIEQQNPHTGEFDEHKVMIGFKNKTEAVDAYVASYNDDAKKRIGRVISTNIDDFKSWLDTHYPYTTGNARRPEGRPPSP